MDVEAVAERSFEGRDVGDLGQQSQLDLRIVGRRDLHSGRRHEGAPDLAAFLGADRDILKVRLGGGEAARGGRGQRVAGVHAMGVGIDVARQRVGVG